MALTRGLSLGRIRISNAWLSYALASVLGCGTGAIAMLMFMQLSPLTTHQVVVPLNGAASTAPVALEGLSELPKLLLVNTTANPWAIAGGTLLRVGLTQLSILALRRAVARDHTNAALHVALGEAVVLAN